MYIYPSISYKYMEKRWVLKSETDKEKVKSLAQELNISSVLSQLLIQRGVQTFSEAKAFFRPSMDALHDPFLIKDMDLAITRIEKAIAQNEKILIYGDYDVDGTTAVSLLYNFLRDYYPHIDTYIPNRYDEGYGISLAGIDYAQQHAYTLVIALDCGIRSLQEVAYATALNIDFIIGDHHIPGEELPEAVAVLDPHRADCPYPYRDLSGCGIAFKIAHAFLKRKKLNTNVLNKYLDLLAVSIISDIVPVTGENRLMAQLGLAQLNKSPCAGLKALVKLQDKYQKIGVREILFQIAPRINAAGRMDHALQVVNMLTTKDPEKAKCIAEEIDRFNEERKSLDKRITGEALSLLDKEKSHPDKQKLNLAYRPDWHKGVVGIVASRVIERLYRPTIILTKSKGKITGSARSVHGIDIHNLLSQCEELLEKFGGHPFAAGMTLAEKNLPEFLKKMHNLANTCIPDDLLVEQIRIDSYIALREIDNKFFTILRQFEPHGPKNPRPIFLSKKVEVVGSPYIIGTNHLKFAVKQGDSAIFDCIGFGLGDEVDLLIKTSYIDICYSITENKWNGKNSIQLDVKGVK